MRLEPLSLAVQPGPAVGNDGRGSTDKYRVCERAMDVSGPFTRPRSHFLANNAVEVSLSSLRMSHTYSFLRP